MRRKSKWGSAALLVILAGFLAGVAHLFLLRFEAGDTYPVYSSLRTDPLGTRALFESLGALEGVTAARNYRPLAKLGGYPGATLILPGVRPFSLDGMPAQEARALESFVLDGGRLVCLLYPVQLRAEPPKPAEKSAAGEKKESEGKERQKDDSGKDPAGKKQETHDAGLVSLAERWKVQISEDVIPAAEKGPRDMNAAPLPGHQDLTEPVTWHSSLWFESPDQAWNVLYVRDGKPVIIERPYGKGTIVLASDSWFVSNEALVRERRPLLLAWLAGRAGTVIFDETHFGVNEDPGVAALGAKYRLQGLLAGLLLLAALFIWQNSMSLVPPGDGRRGQGGDVRSGKDSLAGLAGLLRRTIPRGDILAVCAETWKKTNRKGAAAAEEAALIDSAVENEAKLPARGRNPVAAYRRIHTLLSERKRMT